MIGDSKPEADVAAETVLHAIGRVQDAPKVETVQSFTSTPWPRAKPGAVLARAATSVHPRSVSGDRWKPMMLCVALSTGVSFKKCGVVLPLWHC